MHLRKTVHLLRLHLLFTQWFLCSGTAELFATCAKKDIRVWHTLSNRELLRIDQGKNNKPILCPSSEKQSNAKQYTWQVILSLFYRSGCKKKEKFTSIHFIVSGFYTRPCEFLVYFCGYNLAEGRANFPFFKTTGEASGGEVLVC